jgi:PEGA domain
MVRYVVVILLVLSSVARADDGGIALEVYTGERSADASRLVGPILDELTRQKISTGDTVGRMVENTVSKPARTVKGLPQDFGTQADTGFNLWVSGKFDDAVKLLGPLVDIAHQNSGAFAKDTTLREHLRKALIGLALAQMRRGDPSGMHTTFEEYVRSFTDASVPKAVYGPDAASAFDGVKKDVLSLGLGKLTVRTVQTGSTVFVDETYRGSGTTTVEVPAGEYRVVVMANDQPSRTHFATVHGGGESTVVVDAAFDQAVHTTGWTGFQFATAAAREAHEAAYAAQLARDVGARSVALVGIDTVKSHSSIVGSLVSLESGLEIRRAGVALDPDPSTENLKALARFLNGEAAAPGLQVIATSKTAVAMQVTPHEEPHEEVHATGGTVAVDRYWTGFKWISAAITVGLAGTSGTLFYLNGHCNGEAPLGHVCNNVYNNRPYDHDFAYAAVPFAIATVVLFVAQTKQVPYVAPTEHGAVAGYSFSW